MAQKPEVDDLSEEQATKELADLAQQLAEANTAYHTEDAPRISDAEYDALKARNAAIEERFPHLKRADSPSDQVGAAPSEAFAKVTHAVRMLSLGNAFDDADITEFDTRIRRYLGLGDDATGVEAGEDPSGNILVEIEDPADGLGRAIGGTEGQAPGGAAQGRKLVHGHFLV